MQALFRNRKPPAVKPGDADSFINTQQQQGMDRNKDGLSSSSRHTHTHTLRKRPTYPHVKNVFFLACALSRMTPKHEPLMFNSTIAAISVSNLVWWHRSCCVESWKLRKRRLLDLCCPGNLQSPRMNGGEGRRWDHHYLVSLLLSQLPLIPRFRQHAVRHARALTLAFSACAGGAGSFSDRSDKASMSIVLELSFSCNELRKSKSHKSGLSVHNIPKINNTVPTFSTQLVCRLLAFRINEWLRAC